MVTPDAVAAGPTADRAAGGVPPGPPPDDGTDAWRSLATLGAVIAVWPELSVGLRLRIAGDVLASLTPADPHDASRP